MRHYLMFLTIVLLTAFIVGCNSAETKVSEFAQKPENKATPQPAAPSDGARRVTVNEAKELLDKGKAVVIDVRNQASYDQGHVRSAKLIPAAEILNHVDELPRDKTIITYCS
jgi:predicted sulfurtransferase